MTPAPRRPVSWPVSTLGGVLGLAAALALAACIDIPQAPEQGPGEWTPPNAPAVPSFPPEVEPPPVDPGDQPLTLAGVEPERGPVIGGTQVLLKGTGFVEDMVVLVDQSPVLDLFVAGPTAAVFTTPPHPSGLVDVLAVRPDSEDPEPAVLPAAFLYESDLTIAGVQPADGDVRGGDPIAVVGTGFEPGTRFFVGGRAAIDQARVDGETLIGITPPGAWGPADIAVVGPTATAEAPDAFTYRTAPVLRAVSPVNGPAAGGTPVRLAGEGLEAGALVRFGDGPAEVTAAAPDGTWLEVTAPPGPPGALADLEVATGWGLALAPDAWSWTDPEADPFLLACTHLFPASGSTAGGEEVRLACQGLQYGVTVRFGDAPASVISAEGGEIVAVAPPGPEGAVTVRVASPFDEVAAGTWTRAAPSGLAVDAVSPASGPPEGGTAITVTGAGFGPGASLVVGALPAAQVVVASDSVLTAVTPPGSPGLADVRVVLGADEATRAGAFTFTSGALELALVAPSTAAKCGGTWLRVVGDGFDPDARVFIGGAEAPIIARVSPAELHVRSPRLEVGTWDARVVSGGAEATLAQALTTFDPRSGYGGTWGGPIDGALNVTVRGTQGIGAVPGAFVVARDEAGRTLEGYTNDEGQVTLSEPWLRGTVDVTASAAGFTSYSVVHFDARNVTIFLRPTVPPPPSGGGGGGGDPLPPALLRGQVLGLGKYVVAPPGSCVASAGAATPDAPHCQACEPDAGCGADGFACLDLLEQGNRCLGLCELTADCPAGYVCAAAEGGTRCMPDPGERIARCGLSNTSVFSQDIYVPPTGWVAPGGSFEFDTQRLGELAIVCFGGFRDPYGVFTPTALGVRRHVFAAPGQVVDGLDVSLDHPLNRTFRLRLMDPPTWPDGVQPPSITITLDLGPDGTIPFTRMPLAAGDDTWLATRQLSALSGELADTSYVFYTSLPAVSDNGFPTAYNLVQNVTRVVEDRLPLLTSEGWTLETTQVRRDLFGLWGPSSDHLLAVGEGGLILLHNGVSWTAQSSGTTATLRAIAGRSATDAFAVGDGGTVLRWDGLAWTSIAGPPDDFRAAATAPGAPLYAAGPVRVRRWEPATGWAVEGPPWLQDVHGLAATASGHVLAVGAGGRLALRGPDGAWATLASPTSERLVGAWLAEDAAELIAVGDRGTLVEGPPGALAAVDTGVVDDLTAVTVAQGGVAVAVGDNGRALRRVGGVWAVDVIPDYRSKAQAVHAPADGGPVRVVGGAAFILGPFLHYPVLVGTEAAPGGGLTLAWSWDGGPAGQFTQLTVYDWFGPDLWTLIVEGAERQALLPDLDLLAGLEGVGTGQRSLEILRVLNDSFDIDDYTTREFSIFRRESWTLNRAEFFAP